MFEDPEKHASIQEVLAVEDMPIKARSSGLWDIQVQIQGEGQLERVASINHPIQVKMTPSKKSAIVNLKSTVDRSLVPNKDFVLYIRDEGISKPTAISVMTNNGQQAISLKMLTDTRSEHVKSRIIQELESRREALQASGIDSDQIDVDAEISYARNELE